MEWIVGIFLGLPVIILIAMLAISEYEDDDYE